MTPPITSLELAYLLAACVLVAAAIVVYQPVSRLAASIIAGSGVLLGAAVLKDVYTRGRSRWGEPGGEAA